MGTEVRQPRDTEDARGLSRAVLTMLLVGAALGIAYNAMGLASRPAWGLSWVGEDRVDALPELTAEALPGGVPAAASFTTDVNDPMAIGIAPRAAAAVPAVPELDRPMQLQLEAAKQFFDADAALFVDARDPEEYAAGHVPGAISLPGDLAMSEPERLTDLAAEGRPIITYCGGGACEISIDLAWEILFAGHKKVLVFMGGFPEWVEAGFPVEREVGAE